MVLKKGRSCLRMKDPIGKSLVVVQEDGAVEKISWITASSFRHIQKFGVLKKGEPTIAAYFDGAVHLHPVPQEDVEIKIGEWRFHEEEKES